MKNNTLLCLTSFLMFFMLACRTPPTPEGSPNSVNSSDQDIDQTLFTLKQVNDNITASLSKDPDIDSVQQALFSLVDNFFDKKQVNDNITVSLSEDPDIDSVQQALFSLIDNFFDKKQVNDDITVSLSGLANISELVASPEQEEQDRFIPSILPKKEDDQHSSQADQQGKKREKGKEEPTQKNVKFKRTKIITEKKQQITEQPTTNPITRSYSAIKHGELLARARQGDIEAQANLGKKAYRQRIGWLKEAADCGHQQAINSLQEVNPLKFLKQDVERFQPAKLRLLPVNIWKDILSYLPPTSIGVVRQANRLFYGLIKKNINTWIINEEINFSQLNLNSFSHFQFRHLVRKAKNLPREFWPYVMGSHVQEINLSFKLIGNTELILFTQCLQGSNVHTIHLNINQIHHIYLPIFTKTLQSTKVNTVILANGKNKESLKRVCPAINWI